jgi:hypothetical protein
MSVKDRLLGVSGVPFVWGSTPAEVKETLPCDVEVGRGPRTEPHRAMDIAAPVEVVYRWLCQIRAAPYSYDLLNNLGRRSPRQLTPGLEHLETGQRFMTLFVLVGFSYNEHITIRLDNWFARKLLKDLAISYVVRPTGPSSTRLIVKLTLPRAKGLGWLYQYSMGWLDMLMMSKQMRNIRDLSERHARSMHHAQPKHEPRSS